MAMKGSSDTDIDGMSKQLDTMQEIRKNPLVAMTKRPADVPGSMLNQRLKHIFKLKKDAGDQMDAIANSLKGGAPVDVSKALQGVSRKLEGYGIEVDPVTHKVNYKNSVFDGLKTPQNAISRLVKKLSTLSKKTNLDAHDIHVLKKFIDEGVSYGGKSDTGLMGSIEVMLKDFRHGINTALGEKFPEYKRVNTQYSEAMDSLESLQKATGASINFKGNHLETALGTSLGKLMSKYPSRQNMINAVNQIDEISRKYGGEYDDNINLQVLFANELDYQFGDVARASHAASVARGTKEAANVATGQKTIFGTGLEYAAGKYDDFRGVDQDGAMKAMREYVDSIKKRPKKKRKPKSKDIAIK